MAQRVIRGFWVFGRPLCRAGVPYPITGHGSGVDPEVNAGDDLGIIRRQGNRHLAVVPGALLSWQTFVGAGPGH